VRIVDPREPHRWWRFGAGVALVPLLHYVGVKHLSRPFLSQFRAGYGELFGWQGSFIILIGVYQLIYVVPALAVLALLRQRNVARGLLVGAIVTALLNGACILVLRYAP
jgi:hypothetical protein